MKPAGATGLLYAAWLVALAAALGSLFFGEVMELPPCTLCWYQRICMFPLALLLPIGIVLRDPRVTHYCLPLAAIGLAIAVWHNLLDYGVISESLAPCTEGVSCATRQIEWLGFVTIPALALAGFAAILACLVAYEASVRRARARDRLATPFQEDRQMRAGA
jgi:disulfide bond formation protein DsbB